MNRFYTKAIAASFATLIFATTSLFGQQTSNVNAIDCIPAKSAAYVHINLQGLTKYKGIDFFKALIQEVQSELDELSVDQCGVPASEFKEAVAIVPPLAEDAFQSMAMDPAKNMLGMVTFVSAIDPEEVVGKLDGDWKLFNANGRKVMACKERGVCLYHFADNAIIVGSNDWVTWFMQQRVEPVSNQGVAKTFSLAASGQVTAGINAKAFPESLRNQIGQGIEHLDWAGLSIDLSDGFRVKLASEFDTSSGAKAAVKQIEGFKSLVKFQFKGTESTAMRQFRNRDARAPEIAVLALSQLATARYGLKTLKGLDIAQNNNQVVAELHAKEFDLAATAMICLTAVQAVGTSANTQFEQISAELERGNVRGKTDKRKLPKKQRNLLLE